MYICRSAVQTLFINNLSVSYSTHLCSLSNNRHGHHTTQNRGTNELLFLYKIKTSLLIFLASGILKSSKLRFWMVYIVVFSC